MTLTVVGLGSGAVTQLTHEAWELLTSARAIYTPYSMLPLWDALPTGSIILHELAPLFPVDLNDKAALEEAVRPLLAIIREPQNVIYATPGNGLADDAFAVYLIRQARRQNLMVRVSPGISQADLVCRAVGLDEVTSGLQVLTAIEVATRRHPPLLADRPVVLTQFQGPGLAKALQQVLLSAYPDAHSVSLVQWPGLPREQLHTCALSELHLVDQSDGPVALYLPPLPSPASCQSFHEVVAHLRAPDGCSWDRMQTHLSLRRDLLEETYEVLAALDAEDVESLREELGDLLLHVIMHAQIATEAGEFKLSDVIHAIGSKLIRRHPHVFGDVQVKDEADLLRKWESIKQQEKVANGHRRSLLASVPLALPALSQAQGYVERARRLGLQVDSWSPDAARQLLQALVADEPDPVSIGQGLFILAAVASVKGIDLEGALRSANMAFARQVEAVEEAARRQGAELADLPADAQAALWRNVSGQLDPAA